MGWSVDPSSLNQRDQRTQNVLSLFQNNLTSPVFLWHVTRLGVMPGAAPPADLLQPPRSHFRLGRSNTHIQREQSQSCDIKYSTGCVHVWWYLNVFVFISTECKFRISSVPNKIMRWLFTALIPILRLVLTDSGLTETRYFAPSCTWPGESERENILGFITTFQTLFSFTQCR